MTATEAHRGHGRRPGAHAGAVAAASPAVGDGAAHEATGAPTPPRAFAEARDGGRLAYAAQPGAGLAIIDPLSYGVTLDGIEAAPGQGQFLHAMAAGSYLVTYDQRGAGASAAAGPPASWEERGDDLWRVADAAGVERAVLYGVADAGHTVVHAAIQQPDRVLAIIFNFVPPSFSAATPVEGVLAERAQGWFGGDGEPRRDAVAMMQAFGIAESDAAHLIDAWQATVTSASLEATRRLLASADIRPLLPRLTQPTLVLEPQRTTMFRGWGTGIAALLPDARLARPARGIEALGTIHGFLSLLEVELGRRASELSPALGRALLSSEQSMRELHRIAVAVDDDVTSARAVELACRLGEAQRSEIALIHVVPVPYALSLGNPPSDLVKRGERALSLGDAIVQRHGLPPAKRRLVRGRTIAASILATAEELGSNLIVVANKGTADGTSSSSEVVGELLRRAPGKVVVDRAGP
ncbi:MAG TPA: universal stress protein [Dehalococcoidia bacterium]|nr:universal stress protein [Dehalococcoidia bacterium]